MHQRPPPPAAAAPRTTPTCSRLSPALRRVRETWRVLDIVWQAVRAALTLVKLEQLPQALHRVLEHLERVGEVWRPKQIVQFLLQLDPISG